MGIISKGILGGFSGTVGTVVGGTWKGISYMRSQPAARKGSFSEAQLQQQARFALVIKFLQPFTGLLALSFKDYAIKMSGFNNAFRYTIQNAVTGAYPNFEIDYRMALISRGDLPNAVTPTATSTTTGKVNFEWSNNTGVGSAKATDKAILLVYCPSLNQCVYTVAGADRSMGEAVLEASSFTGLQVQTYIGFISADGKNLATSFYTGQLIVNPVP